MHKLKSVQETDTHKILSNIEIQTDHIISARRPDFVLIYKKRRKKLAILKILLSRLTTEWK